MESNRGNYNNRITSHFHYGSRCQVPEDSPTSSGHVAQNESVNFGEDFHTFGVIWMQNSLIFELDGVQTWNTTNNVSTVARSSFYIILDL
eukprot:COSAG05_NODE_21674_length_270_cov_0.608187_1_plen_89_part_11